MKQLGLLFIFLLFVGLLSGCPSTTKNNVRNGNEQVQSLPCLKGKISNDDGNMLVGAVISIKPAPAKTSQISGSKGDFELCYLLKVLNKDTRETAKVPIKKGTYTLTFSAEGHKEKSKQIAFVGKTISVGEITLESTEKKTGNVKDSGKKNQKKKKRDPIDPSKHVKM